MGLRLYNTLGREIQDFVPLRAGHVGFYGCGPTVYNYAHIGNLRAYVFLDILDRTLSYLGYTKTHVMNITDVGHLSGDSDSGEDKMVRSAAERHESVLDVAKFYTEAFFRDTDRLNIRRPDIVCRATEHIPDMIALIRRIEANGHTYTAGGNLYYDVTTFPDYGKLAGLDLAGLKAGARVGIDRNKRNPCDFVLWFTKSKFEKQALVWDSPWGRGYPGWHIECSAMSMKYLGEQFDIHTGGIDHIPVHHTNEIAQSEGATGRKWVNYWLHNEFLVIKRNEGGASGAASAEKASALSGVSADGGAVESGGADKMSKSAGNFLTLQTLIDRGYDALDYRFLLLGAHYRSQIMFSWAALDSARNARRALVQRAAKMLDAASAGRAGGTGKAASAGGRDPQGVDTPAARSGSGVRTPAASAARETSAREEDFSEKTRGTLQAFRAALENDLSTPQALSALQAAVKDGASCPDEALSAVRIMDGVLGLRIEEEAAKVNAARAASQVPDLHSDDPEAAEIQALLAERDAAKKAKCFEKADQIRNDLSARGVLVTDTPQGSVWKRK